MRLYPRRDGTDSVDYGGVLYKAQPDGGFDFPPDLTELLHSAHANKEPMWEDQIERQRRLILAEAARRADPATLLSAVEQLVRQAEASTPAPQPAKPAAKAKAAA
jgi:hypothetical protein